MGRAHPPPVRVKCPCPASAASSGGLGSTGEGRPGGSPRGQGRWAPADTARSRLVGCLRCGIFTDPTAPGLTAARFRLPGRARDPRRPPAGAARVARAQARPAARARRRAGGPRARPGGRRRGPCPAREQSCGGAEWLGRVSAAAEPLGDQIGWDIARSHILDQAQHLLGSSSGTFTLIACSRTN